MIRQKFWDMLEASVSTWVVGPAGGDDSLYPGRSKEELARRRGRDEAHVDDHRGRQRAGQLQMVPGAVRSAGYPSCP
jgi:hypothetical protein